MVGSSGAVVFLVLVLLDESLGLFELVFSVVNFAAIPILVKFLGFVIKSL